MHRFDTPQPPNLRIDFRAGEITIDGQDTTQTTVELTGRRDDEATRALIADTVIEQRGDTIVVHVPKQGVGFFGRTPELDLRITAPTGSLLAVRAASADVTCHGSLGGGRVETGSGEVTVTHLTGDARIRTGSGDVRVDSTDGALEVQAGSGEIEIGSAGGAASLQAGSGDVIVEHAGAGLKAQTGSGDVRVRDADGTVEAQSGSGDVRLELISRGDAKVNAASGDIHVGVADGTAAWLDVRTLTGRVHSDLEATDEPGDTDKRVRLRLNTVSGDITVVRN